MVVKYKTDHLRKLLECDATQYLKSYITDEMIEYLEKSEFSFSGIDGEKVVICAGVIPRPPNRGEAWAILDKDSGKYMLPITRAVQSFLRSCPIKRIEASVSVDFKAGHRWAKMLGFDLEAERMLAYEPNGGDCSLYAKVRD